MGRATGDIRIENSYLDLTDGRITYREGGTILTSGRYSLGYPRADGDDEINARIEAERMSLEPLRTAFGLEEWPVQGTLTSASLTLRGAYEKPGGSGTLRLDQGTAWKEPFDSAEGSLRFERDGSVTLERMTVRKGPGVVTGNAHLSWATDSFEVNAASAELPLDQIKSFRFERAPLSGMLRDFTATGSGTFDRPHWEIAGVVPDLYAADEGIGALRGRLTLADNVLTVREVAARSDRLQVGCSGTIALSDAYDANLNCQFTGTSLDPYFKFIGRELPFNQVIASGSISATGPLKDTPHLTANARVDDVSLRLSGYLLKNDGPGLCCLSVRMRFASTASTSAAWTRNSHWRARPTSRRACST
jgi:hypothetical protein